VNLGGDDGVPLIDVLGCDRGKQQSRISTDAITNKLQNKVLRKEKELTWMPKSVRGMEPNHLAVLVPGLKASSDDEKVIIISSGRVGQLKHETLSGVPTLQIVGQSVLGPRNAVQMMDIVQTQGSV
jgi:hypothetical protein